MFGLSDECQIALFAVQNGVFIEFFFLCKKFPLSLHAIKNILLCRRMNILKKIISVASLAVGIAACSTETPTTVECGSINGDVEVCFSMPADATRTTIGDDGRTTHWAQDDKLAVWAKDASGNFVFRNTTFTLRHFSDSYDKAFFSGSVAEMAEGDYTYLLSYPTPNRVIGTLATYNVAATQSGKYDGKYDIMIAEPVTEGSLTTGNMVTLNTTMRHQMHALKITIPEGRNLFGARFTRLEITFPVDVVGDVTYDINNLNEEPIYTNMSNVITVENDEGFDAGDDIWVFVLPGTVNGDVSYKVESETQRSVVNTYPLSRTMAAGHVTPIRMATPELYRYTSFVLSEGVNNLGENINSFQVYDKDNALLASFARNAENKYEFGFEGNIDFTPWHNTDLRLVIESEHAIVETTVHIGTIDHSHMNVLTPFVVPYLFEENFSGLNTSWSDMMTSAQVAPAKTPTTRDLSSMGIKAGWTGSHTGGEAGNAMSVFTRVDEVLAATRTYGRLDSPQLTGLKSGASANLKVSFSYSGGRSGNEAYSIIGVFGRTTTTGPIGARAKVEGSPTWENITDYVDLPTIPLTGSYANIDQSVEYTMTGVTSACRLSWIVMGSGKTSIVANGNQWMYIDNIKVQIAK